MSFIKNWAGEYENWDYIIVPSKFFEDNVKGNVLGLGWSKADYYINNKDKQDEFKSIIKTAYNIADDKPLILFAPTYAKNKSTQLPGNADKLMGIVNALPHCHIIFMPHVMCDYKVKYKDYKLKVAADYKHKAEYLLGCDLLIGDTSSIVFEFALLDKPIVLLNNVKYEHYLKIARPGMNESLDLGEIVPTDNILSIRQAVDSSLSNPDKYKSRREYWVDKALGYCDGNSTKKIVDKIEEICGQA